jgi:hypothetical protein
LKIGIRHRFSSWFVRVGLSKNSRGVNLKNLLNKLNSTELPPF